MHTIFLVLLFLFVLFPVYGSAEVREQISEGVYTASPGELAGTAQAKSAAMAHQKAVALFPSSSLDWNALAAIDKTNVTPDTAALIVRGILETIPMEQKISRLPDGRFQYYTKLRTRLDTALVPHMRELVKDRFYRATYDSVSQQYTKACATLSARETASVSPADDPALLSDDAFLALFWTEAGFRAANRGDFKTSTAAFTLALASPDREQASLDYYLRGTAYFATRNFQKSLDDFDACIESGPCEAMLSQSYLYKYRILSILNRPADAQEARTRFLHYSTKAPQ